MESIVVSTLMHRIVKPTMRCYIVNGFNELDVCLRNTTLANYFSLAEQVYNGIFLQSLVEVATNLMDFLLAQKKYLFRNSI